MRILMFIAMTALLFAACTGSGEPADSNSLPAQPEVAGSHPNSEQQGTAFSISTEAYYQASLQSASSPGRVISLSLTPEGNAAMTTDYLNKSPAIKDTGEWTTLENGNLLLNLRRVGKSDSTTLEFKTDGDKLVYTGSDYGPAGFTLWAKPVSEVK